MSKIYTAEERAAYYREEEHRIRKEVERYRAALLDICEDAPTEEPKWYDGDNHTDTADNAAEREHYRLAQIARAALAATEGGGGLTAPTEPLTPPWAYYRRTGLSEMRPYVPGEDMTGVSVSASDYMLLAGNPDPGGFIARNPKNHADKWYVAQAYFEANLEPVDSPPRDPAAELRAALERIERMVSPDNKGWASGATRLNHAHLIAQYALKVLPHQQEAALRAALAASEGSESC